MKDILAYINGLDEIEGLNKDSEIIFCARANKFFSENMPIF